METSRAIEGIVHWRSQIHEKNMWQSKDALSEVLSRLAVYNSYLADNLASAHKVVTDKAYAVYIEATSKGTGVTASEALARGESTGEREHYENIKNIHKATEGLISVLQTRIRVME